MPAILLEVDDNNVKEFSCDITEDNRNVTLYTKLEFCFQHACDKGKSLYYKEVETQITNFLGFEMFGLTMFGFMYMIENGVDD